jgi:hypothetical protein
VHAAIRTDREREFVEPLPGMIGRDTGDVEDPLRVLEKPVHA